MKNLIYLLTLALFIFSCGQPEISELSPDDILQPPVCDCNKYVSVKDGLPVYDNIEAFEKASNCLEKAVDDHNNYLNEKYADISEEDYLDLIEKGIVNENQPLVDFLTKLNGQSLLQKDLKLETKWLERNRGNETLDFSTLSTEFNYASDVIKAMFNEKGLAIIDGEISPLDVTDEEERPICKPKSVGTNNVFNSSQRTQVWVRGALGRVGSVGNAFITGQMIHYKRKNNGSYARSKTRLSISCRANLRTLGDCDETPVLFTSFKTKSNASTATTTKWLFGVYVKVIRSGNVDGIAQATAYYSGSSLLNGAANF